MVMPRSRFSNVMELPAEAPSVGAGPVVTYQLDPEELDKYRALPAPNGKKPPTKYELTREQYLDLRVSGKTKKDIALEHLGNNIAALKGFLSVWGLLDSEAELAEVEKLRPKQPVQEDAAQEKPMTVVLNKPSITKEFVEAEFKKGKAIRTIEQEQGMSKGSLSYHVRKWGITSPHPNSRSKTVKTKAEKPVVTMAPIPEVFLQPGFQKGAEHVQPSKPLVDEKLPWGEPAATYARLEFPLLRSQLSRVEQRVKVYQALDVFEARAEDANSDRQLLIDGLLELNQAVIDWIQRDIEDVHPDEDAKPHVLRFFENRNQKHLQKFEEVMASGI